jgi:glycine/D-amino acid oxidase-like deaminating enzyme/nitrite reductase/ring-hydroxylating ferredoxin subunit
MDTTSARSSLWLDGSDGPDYPRLEGDRSFDVAVVGGGIAGLTTALLLKRAGLHVCVIEANRVGRGVTGTTTAKVSALQSTVYSTIADRHGPRLASAYAEASLAGVGVIADLVTELDVDCDLERRPAITYAAEPDDASDVEAEAEAARAAGLDAELVAEIGLPFKPAAAVRLDDQLQLHPVRLANALAAALDGEGSAVFEGTRALGVSAPRASSVKTAEGTVHAGRIVIATHYPLLDRGLYFARLEAERSYCIAARVRGELPRSMCISAGEVTRSVRAYGNHLIVGGESHPAGSRAATEERFERLEMFARDHWEVEEITHRWSAQDPVPFDRLPMIGPYTPGSNRLFVSTGFMKWGLATAAFGALMIRDAVTGGRSPWSDAFDPNRISLRSLPSAGKLGAKFVGDIVGDRLQPGEVGSAADVPSGEGKVVRRGHRLVGVYRDEAGTAHEVSLRCTHLGCLLRFNAAERSWDCPCHGSRFGVDGEVLEGPAVAPLDAPRSTPAS